MPIKDIDEFASTGTKTEPSTSEKARGWVGGEQVAGDQHNWWMNEVTDKLNEIVDQGVDTTYPVTSTAPTDTAKKVVATQLWATDHTPWGIGDDTANTVDIGDHAICAMQSYYGSGNDYATVMVLEGASDANVIYYYDVNDLSTISNSGTLSTDNANMVAQDFCTDGTHVWVLFLLTSTNIMYVNKYDIATWTKRWTDVSSGLLTGGSPTNAHIIIADDTYVAVATDDLQDPRTTCVAVHARAGGGQAGGIGDSPGDDVNDDCTGAIASDGTNLYFGFDDASGGEDVVCSAVISDLSDPGLANFPTSGAGVNGIVEIACPAPDLVVSFWSNTGTIIMRAYESSTGLCDTISDGGSPVRTYPLEIFDVCFDGLNFWILGYNNQGDFHRALFKVPAAKLSFSANNAASTGDFDDFIGTGAPFLLDAQQGNVVGTSDVGCMVFDGRDIWVAPEPDSGQTLSGEIYRLPRANNR